MSYIKDVEQDLDGLLAGVIADAGEHEKIITFVSEKIVESYKNGLQAGTKRAQKQTGSTKAAA